MKLRVAVLGLLVLAAGPWVLPVAADTLSRADAVARAIDVNPQVRKSEEDLVRYDGIITEARADALPEVTLHGSFNRYRDPSLLNSSSFDDFPPELRDLLKPIPQNIYEGTATLRQTLFDFKVGKALRAARYGRAFGHEELQGDRQAVALLAVQAYNEYLLSLERVKVAEKAVRQREGQLEIARNRRAAGVATDLDVLRFEVSRENQRAELLRVQGQADLSRGRLNAVMVRPIDGPVTPTDTLEYIPFEITIDEAVSEAWSNRPEVRAINLTEKIRHELVGIAKADARPSLEFDGAYGWSVRDPNNFLNQEFTKWSLSVFLKIPVFDGLRTAGRVAQAKAEENKVIQDRVALENEIRLEAKGAVDRLQVAKRVLDVADLTVNQAQKALDMTEANYRLGAATPLDVLDAQASLTLAESNRNEALYAHANARASLRYVMARDPLDPPRPAGPQRTQD
jgi:HAE1 family hydrophobic/amphiphilic exporter-1